MKWLAKSKVKPKLGAFSPKSISKKVINEKVINKKVTKKKIPSDAIFENVKIKTPVQKKRVATDSSVKYYVQAGAFSAMPNKKYLSKIKSLGLHYTVRQKDNYKVLIGEYKNEKDAREALKKVREHISIGAFIVKL